jgi:hypothetical protein
LLRRRPAPAGHDGLRSSGSDADRAVDRTYSGRRLYRKDLSPDEEDGSGRSRRASC